MRLIKGTFCEECEGEWPEGKPVIDIEISTMYGIRHVEICKSCLEKAIELIEGGGE